jgi:tetratricopeptide (TPR) repeat protein
MSRYARVLGHAAVLALLLSLTVGSADAQHGSTGSRPPARSYSTEPVARDEVAAWREDLTELLEAVKREHPEPYRRTSRPDLERAVAALRDSIPRLPAHRIIVGFARLLASIGDGHTSLPLYFAAGVDFHVLPYRLGVYDDGVYVEAADRAYAELVGRRVTAIGDVRIDEALRRVASLISRDNDNWIAAVAPHLLNRIEVLHALGMAPDLTSTTLTAGLGAASTETRVAALPSPPATEYGVPFLVRLTHDWVDARDTASRPPPLHQRRFDEIYFWEYLPEHDVLYIKWDQVQNRVNGPTALTVIREAMTFARERRPAKTVLDIRNNTGGNGGLLPPIIREIVRTREIDEPGKLFLVIGRRTFSAGQMMTSDLEQYSSAILVGEPSSAHYTGPAGHEMVALPNSRVSIAIAPDSYQMGAYPRDPRRQATPRLAAVPTFEDYASNRDPALEAVLAYDPESLTREVMAALAAGDTAAAEGHVRAFDARPVNRFRDATVELNALGYRLLREGRTEAAVSVFELNVRLHPRYANGWDSLGEAYVRTERRSDAIVAFRRAIALEPGLAPSREWLRRLGAAER